MLAPLQVKLPYRAAAAEEDAGPEDEGDAAGDPMEVDGEDSAQDARSQRGKKGKRQLSTAACCIDRLTGCRQA